MKDNVLNRFKVVVFSGLFLAGNTFAEDTAPPAKQKLSSVELGALYTTQDSFKFGKYSGLEKKGAHAIANIHARGRDPHDGTTAHYWRLQGSNLGLTSREADAEYGNQGNFKLWAGYDELPTFQTESAKTIFSGGGSTNLTLPPPPGWTAANTTSGLTKLSSSLQNLEIDHKRRKGSLGFSKLLAPGWELSAGYQREVKEGSKLTGAAIGNGGVDGSGRNRFNPRFVLIPEPIDYVTNQWVTRLGYTTSRTQVQASYTLSLFENRNTALTWSNPYSGMSDGVPPQWATAANYPTGKGRMALPPNNRAHQLMLNFGHNISSSTRVTGNFSKGRMSQNQAFLPYAVPGLVITSPLPRTSLNGQIDTTLATLKITSRPFSRFQWTAQYRYHDRKNNTPSAQYLYSAADSQDQQPKTTNKARTNLPHSFKQNQFKLDGNYHLPANTQLRGSYTLDVMNRTFAEVRRTNENTYRVELRRNEVDMFGGGVYSSIAKRNGTAYDGTLPYLNSHSPEHLSTITPSDRFSNPPNMRIFSMADRLRKQLGFWVSCTPHDTLSLQVDTRLNKDDYTRSVLGLRDSKGIQTTFDATYTPFKYVTSHAFYTHEFLNAHRNGSTGSSGFGLGKLAQANDLTKRWPHKQRDRIHTVGAGIEFTELRDKFDLGMEYLFSASHGANRVSTEAIIPAVTSRLHNVEVYGKYKIANDVKAKISYAYESFRSRNWAYDKVPVGAIDNGVLSGELSPRYAVSTVALSLNYDF